MKVLTSDVDHFPEPGDLSVRGDIIQYAPAFCDPGNSDRSNGTRICSREDVLKAIASRSLAFEPWTRPLYSNTGFNLLGWATAQAAAAAHAKIDNNETFEDEMSSPTLEDLLQDDVFGPLGMKDTSFWVPLEKKNDVAVPGKGVPCMIDWDFTSTFNPYPPSNSHTNTRAGGMYTTANDLARFVQKVVLSPNPNILSSQQVREWLSPLYVFADRQTAVGYTPNRLLLT